MKKKNAEWVVIGLEDHKNYIDIYNFNLLFQHKMTDLGQQVMQLTQDLYVLKHTVIAWKTVEERIKESNTVPDDALIIKDFQMNENWELEEVVVYKE